MFKKIWKLALLIPIFILNIQCSLFGFKKKEWTPETAMLKPSDMNFDDDLGFENLSRVVEDHVQYFDSQLKIKPDMTLQFGAVTVPARVYKARLEGLMSPLQNGEAQKVKDYLNAEFQCAPVAGDGEAGQAFMTSYYNPLLKASRRPNSVQSRPIYRTPPDMVLIKLKEFKEVFPHWTWLDINEQKSEGSVVRGRLVKGETMSSVVPYYSRQQIDQEESLKNQKLELAYLDPIDAFFMQIQGSATLQFEDGQKINVGYAAQNGHPYVAIGKFLKDRISKEDMSLQSIQRELRSMSTADMQNLLNQNPSYVFFDRLKSEPLTTIGTRVHSGRTIATDRRFFPKGTLAYLEFDRPEFESSGSIQNQGERLNEIQPLQWQRVKRIVMDQDTGGAIRGTGRLDLFWGYGPTAERHAGIIKNKAKLCYLVPKNLN